MMNKWSKKQVIAFIVLVKLLIFTGLLLKENPHYITGFWGMSTYGDEMTYLDPVDSLLSKGEYQPDFRMPGLGAAYLPFRLFFDRGTSCNFIMFIQLILDILSVYLLGLIARQLFKSQKAFLLTLLLYTISIPVSYYDLWMMSESLSISFSIIAVYLLLRYLEIRKPSLLLFSGILATWAIFIRPLVGILWLALVLYLFIDFLKSKTWNFKKLVFPILIFCAPFILIDSAWIVRNYKIHKQFIPLMKTDWINLSNVNIENYKVFVFAFVNSFGGDCVPWAPTAEVRWFGILEKPIIVADSIHHLTTTVKDLPNYIYTSRFNKDSLLIIREKVMQLESNTLNSKTKIEYTLYVNSKMKAYRTSIVEEKPFIYYLYGPFRIATKLIVNHGTNDLFLHSFKELNLFEKLIKIQMAMIYLSIIIGGLLGILLWIAKGRLLTPAFILVFYILFHILSFTYIFRNSETRYMLPIYPFLIITWVYFLVQIHGVLKYRYKLL